jgi:hypothetical protein
MEQPMRFLRPITAFGLLVGIVLALAGPLAQPNITALGSNQNVGYVDAPFGNTPGIDVTADKPQSKLWFNDGFWWALMFDTASNTWHIYKLTWPNQWVDTGMMVDNRPTSRGDALWDGTHLYVASLVRFSYANQARLYRYSYNPTTDTYTLEPGYPVVILKTDSSTPNPVTGSAETMAFDKDSTGRLWITFTQSKKVWVNTGLDDGKDWGKPFLVSSATSATNLADDDISSLVAYRDASGPAIGVLWSNHTTNSMHFSYHKDGDPVSVWQPIEQIYTSKCAADDHINLKSAQSDPSGAIFAAVKTSFGDGGCNTTTSSPLIRLVVRMPNNTWKVATFGAVSEDHTRPLVLLDTTNRKVYMFATSPTSCGVIYMKSTSMDNPDFSSEPKYGTPFISSSTYTCINNATSTKQTVDAVSDLVVLAADESKKVYLHNVRDLGTPTPRLVFSTLPAGAQIGAPFTTQPKVSALDGQGRVATSFNGAITLALKGATGATLGGTKTVNAVNGVATFSGLSINQAGTGYVLTASAMGFTSNDSAGFDVAKANQIIAFAPLANKTYGDPPIAVNGTASSSLAVSFSDPNPGDGCTVASNLVFIAHAGVCSVRASQPGNANYNAATDVIQQFSIAKANQSINFSVPAGKTYGDPPFRINADATSALPVSFTARGGCTITDQNLVTLKSQDICTIVASQAGNNDYNAAPSVTQNIASNFPIYLPLILR